MYDFIFATFYSKYSANKMKEKTKEKKESLISFLKNHIESTRKNIKQCK